MGEGRSGIAIHDGAMSGAYPNCARYVPDTRERASVLGRPSAGGSTWMMLAGRGPQGATGKTGARRESGFRGGSPLPQVPSFPGSAGTPARLIRRVSCFGSGSSPNQRRISALKRRRRLAKAIRVNAGEA